MFDKSVSADPTMARSSSLWRLRFFKLVAIFFGVVVGMTFAEAGLRILEKRASPQTPERIQDPVLGVRVAPNAPGHDAKGFRNDKVPTKAEIVAIGDSQTWGVNAQAVDAWPQQLARLSGLPVYNMAIGGTGPAQYLYLTDQALEFSPQTIVIGLYFGNDIYDAYASVYSYDSFKDLRLSQPPDDLKYDTVAARARSLWDEEKNFHYSYGRNSPWHWSVWLREHTAVGRLLNRTRWWPGASDIDYEIDKAWAKTYPDHGQVCEDDNIRTVFTSAYRLTGLDLDDPRVAEGLRITNLVLARIRDKTHGRAELRVLLIPTKELVYADRMREQGRFTGAYAREVEMETRARGELQSWCAENQIKTIDALPQMKSAIARREQLYSSTTESHPNAGGYGVIASVMNDALKATPR